MTVDRVRVVAQLIERRNRLELALQDALAGLAMNREVRERRVAFILREGRLPDSETGEPT